MLLCFDLLKRDLIGAQNMQLKSSILQESKYSPIPQGVNSNVYRRLQLQGDAARQLYGF